MKASNVLETIGHTPLVRINRLFGKDIEVWMKLERANPGGSIKDRIALAMVEEAEEKGLLHRDSVIIEPTSGNTGVGLAIVAAVKGYKLVLVMPESMSLERRRLLAAYGAKLVLTPKEKGMGGAIAKAAELLEETTNAWMPQQFENEANSRVHFERTAKEIITDMPEGFDYLITGVGTGGHITGVTKALKERYPKLKSYAVEPAGSPVIGGGSPGPHPIQGIGAGFIPKILETDLLRGAINVEPSQAFEFTRKLAREEGILAGISTGASLAAIAKKLPEMPIGSKVLTFNYDTGERYWSVEGLYV
ncbi:cysteine synthase [Fulvitalea axinellae]|uniref:Cysteine synthase n=1 Tax=Fulvitalea axinellae TaxID=1182444 RepID=A0AAU9D5Q9_9BACT|nr:cysteine synthase [Fulvitalea axinellae]